MMKATFRIDAENTVEVENVAGGVIMLTHFEGVRQEDGTYPEQHETWFSKSEARSVASAMMGCAAEA